jgi:outer membrane lipoprotein carrier protein
VAEGAPGSHLLAVLSTVGLFLLATPVVADESGQDPAGLVRLRGYLENLNAMRANFRQEVINSDREIVEETRGHVVLKKPGRFRWHYTEPFERVIVGDGTRVWLYEADLQQVTVRQLSAELGETPAALLTGDTAVLEQFNFVGSEPIAGLDWLHLTPRSAASDFKSIGLGFDGDNLVQLALDDRLGQRTRIYLTTIEYPPDVPDDEFHFNIPAGVDVIGEADL